MGSKYKILLAISLLSFVVFSVFVVCWQDFSKGCLPDSDSEKRPCRQMLLKRCVKRCLGREAEQEVVWQGVTGFIENKDVKSDEIDYICPECNGHRELCYDGLNTESCRLCFGAGTVTLDQIRVNPDYYLAVKGIGKESRESEAAMPWQGMRFSMKTKGRKIITFHKLTNTLQRSYLLSHDLIDKKKDPKLYNGN